VYEEDMHVIDESKDRRYDLHDNLFQTWPESHRTVYLGIETSSKNWPVWDEESLQWIEKLIVWDLNFDGEDVDVTRYSTNLHARGRAQRRMKIE